MVYFNPLADFKATSPLIKGVVVVSIVTLVVLASIGAICLWLDTGSFLPFTALGVLGTIGLSTLLAIVITGVGFLLAFAALCLATFRSKKPDIEKVMENQLDNLECEQDSIWEMLTALGCSDMKVAGEEERALVVFGHYVMQADKESGAWRGHVIFKNGLGCYVFDYDVTSKANPSAQAARIGNFAAQLASLE